MNLLMLNDDDCKVFSCAQPAFQQILSRGRAHNWEIVEPSQTSSGNYGRQCSFQVAYTACEECRCRARTHAQSFTLRGKEHWLALSYLELLEWQDFSMAPHVPWASSGLGTGDPVLHLELEPLSSTKDSRTWNWKQRQKLGRVEIRSRPQRNSTFIFPLPESLVLA